MRDRRCRAARRRVLVSDYLKGVVSRAVAQRADRRRQDARHPGAGRSEGAAHRLLRGRDRDHAEPSRGGGGHAHADPNDGRGARRGAALPRARAAATSVLITRGEHGMSLLGADGERDLPAEAREVSDVTGAGDTVIATMTLALAAGASLASGRRLAEPRRGAGGQPLRSSRHHRRRIEQRAGRLGPTYPAAQLLRPSPAHLHWQVDWQLAISRSELPPRTALRRRRRRGAGQSCIVARNGCPNSAQTTPRPARGGPCGRGRHLPPAARSRNGGHRPHPSRHTAASPRRISGRSRAPSPINPEFHIASSAVIFHVPKVRPRRGVPELPVAHALRPAELVIPPCA